MKKLLVRAHMSPFDQYSADQVLEQDLVGTNIGNLIFTGSVIRTLMDEEVQVDTFNTRKESDMSQENIDRINQTYDAVVIPFANAFRLTFQHELHTISKFIRQLKIPCVITGVGVSATFEKPLQKQNPFDDMVREFMDAALEKSAVVGTRGQVTSHYLTGLGYREESQHQVIGCPSMFWYGRELPAIEKRELTEDSPVSVNWKMDLPQEIHRFMKDNISKFHDFCYVPQVLDEILLMYYGRPFPEGKYKKIPDSYPDRADHPFYLEPGRACSFVNISSWMDYMKTRQFSFGSRIHGNIAALLAGTPCFVVVSDYRILELAEYHNIPHIDYRDLTGQEDIFSLYEKADYGRLLDGHEERYSRYESFLKTNGLPAANAAALAAGNSPFDQRMAEMRLQPALTSFLTAPPEEQARRLEQTQKAYTELYKQYTSMRIRLDNVKALEKALSFYRNGKIKWLVDRLRRK